MQMISEHYRKQGVGTRLVEYLKDICKTEKLFTSTNESNNPMQALMAKTGFIYCGQVDALDEGDPEWFYVFLHK